MTGTRSLFEPALPEHYPPSRLPFRRCAEDFIRQKLLKDRHINAVMTCLRTSRFQLKPAVSAEPDQAVKLSAYQEIWCVMRESQLIEP